MIEYDGVSPVGSTFFNFSLDDREYKLDVKSDLMITPGNFEACLMTHAAKMAFYAGLYRTADRLALKAQEDYDVWEASKRNEIRRINLIVDKPVKMTETALDDLVTADIEYPSRRGDVSEITYVRDMLKSFVEAFRDRTSMLMKIGAKVRDANDTDTHTAGELTVRDKQFQDREYRKTRQGKFYDKE